MTDYGPNKNLNLNTSFELSVKLGKMFNSPGSGTLSAAIYGMNCMYMHWREGEELHQSVTHKMGSDFVIVCS